MILKPLSLLWNCISWFNWAVALNISASCGNGYTNSPHTPWELCSSLATDRPQGSANPSPTCSVMKEQNKEKVRVRVLFSSSVFKALREPGQQRGQRWTQECHKHSQGRVTIMTSEACTHKHPCIHTHTRTHTHTYGVKKTEHCNKRNLFACLLVCDVG